MNSTVKVTGLREFNDALARLADSVATKHARGGVAAGARVIYDEAVKNVDAMKAVDSGTLKRSIYRAWISDQSNRERQTFFISIRRGKRFQAKEILGKGGRKRKTANRDAFYGWMIEFGHLATGRGGKIRGGQRARESGRAALRSSGATFVPGRPFMRNAYEAKKLASVDAIRDELGRRIFGDIRKV